MYPCVSLIGLLAYWDGGGAAAPWLPRQIYISSVTISMKFPGAGADTFPDRLDVDDTTYM